MDRTVAATDLAGLPSPRRGKVRDLYDLGEHLLIVATDRISAYDHILDPGIPEKGKILNQLTNYWLERFSGRIRNHLVTDNPAEYPAAAARHGDVLRGRSVLARKAHVVPFECVARGFLAGSGYREYTAGGEVCGIRLPQGLVKADRLPEPIFTPATKAETGHDENVPVSAMIESLGRERSDELERLTLDLYSAGSSRLEEVGLLLADTKFEFGLDGDGLLLIDEVLTPDSSRFWEAGAWQPGNEPVSFDKQFVRNWLDETGWDHESPPPPLPPEVIEGTRERYLEAFRRITGRDPEL